MYTTQEVSYTTDAAPSRAQFIRRTYTHLFGAIALFVLLEVILFKTGAALKIAQVFSGTSWLIILGLYMVLGWVAQFIANSSASRSMSYGGLLLYIVLDAIIFIPLLVIATSYSDSSVLMNSVYATLLGFGALTLIVFQTKADFSFLRSILMWGGVLALIAIVGAILFKVTLGFWFSLGMVAFAGLAVLYDTSKILHHYREDQYVAAALSLFASIALMFWYILRLFIARD